MILTLSSTCRRCGVHSPQVAVSETHNLRGAQVRLKPLGLATNEFSLGIMIMADLVQLKKKILSSSHDINS